ncbi:MAG TPA: hypothetical protein VJR92_11260, partial [Gemmatimonadaceae bacterium]|nr:hypothetical protein [Gemmatimonadaceae bacterium]
RAARGDPPRRLIMWGSALAPEVDLGASAPLRRVPVVFVQGATDRWATPQRIAAERARLDAATFPYEVQQFPGGHRLDDSVLAELAR